MSEGFVDYGDGSYLVTTETGKRVKVSAPVSGMCETCGSYRSVHHCAEDGQPDDLCRLLDYLAHQWLPVDVKDAYRRVKDAHGV